MPSWGVILSQPSDMWLVIGRGDLHHCLSWRNLLRAKKLETPYSFSMSCSLARISCRPAGIENTEQGRVGGTNMERENLLCAGAVGGMLIVLASDRPLRVLLLGKKLFFFCPAGIPLQKRRRPWCASHTLVSTLDHSAIGLACKPSVHSNSDFLIFASFIAMARNSSASFSTVYSTSNSSSPMWISILLCSSATLACCDLRMSNTIENRVTTQSTATNATMIRWPEGVYSQSKPGTSGREKLTRPLYGSRDMPTKSSSWPSYGCTTELWTGAVGMISIVSMKNAE
mmetsp:Transcript_44278/g.115046  ORF Transcript_44278/g.115046 Transcript_44278/m.115046 type:complete len:285 (-) Transcript_44278:1484-2338(-)